MLHLNGSSIDMVRSWFVFYLLLHIHTINLLNNLISKSTATISLASQYSFCKAISTSPPGRASSVPVIEAEKLARVV
jgi:hypothetical protein